MARTRASKASAPSPKSNGTPQKDTATPTKSTDTPTKLKSKATPSKSKTTPSKSKTTPSKAGKGKSEVSTPSGKKSAGKSNPIEIEDDIEIDEVTPKKQDKSQTVTSKSQESQALPSKYIADKQIDKAITELKKFFENESKTKSNNSEKNSLFADDDIIEDAELFVTVSTKKFYANKPSLKPKSIKLSHSIHNKEDLKTCLIIKDDLVTNESELEKIENANLPTLKQILTLNQLKTDYKHFEKRRQLYSQFDLFLADDRIFNSLPNVLGKAFFGKSINKNPTAIRICSNKDKKNLSLVTLQNQFEKVLSSTKFLPPVGTNIVIKTGLINGDLSKKQLVENIQDIVLSFDKDTVRSIFIKTSKSPSLPIFYTDKLYNSSDILENEISIDTKEGDDFDAAYESGLLELADEDTVAKVLGKELSSLKKSSKFKAADKIKKSSKPIKI